MRGVDYLLPISRLWQFPDPTPRAAHEAVGDRRWRTLRRRAIAPATAALPHRHDAADDAAIARSTPPTSVGKNGSLRVAQPQQKFRAQSLPR
jgi:hypothetical protein